jgi:TPR repeat protein
MIGGATSSEFQGAIQPQFPVARPCPNGVEIEPGQGKHMRKSILCGCALMVLASVSGAPSTASAGPWEDGMTAYNRGDYVPAIKLFRPLAQAGNAKAQNVMGVMYRKGQGVARSSARAFMWFSLAAKRGDAQAKAELGEVSRDMTPTEIAQAREMMQACEASNYRDCAY